jgi:hypothetical protein
MGLDAVVYRNREHLQLGNDGAHAKVIRDTGEVYFEDAKLGRKYDHVRKSVAHRLGNIALIGSLREEVSQLIGPESFLERKVLYSGTHSGDVIPLEELDQLSPELNHIRETGRSSPRLKELVNALEQLVQAANYERNPIVFV